MESLLRNEKMPHPHPYASAMRQAARFFRYPTHPEQRGQTEARVRYSILPLLPRLHLLKFLARVLDSTG